MPVISGSVHAVAVHSPAGWAQDHSDAPVITKGQPLVPLRVQFAAPDTLMNTSCWLRHMCPTLRVSGRDWRRQIRATQRWLCHVTAWAFDSVVLRTVSTKSLPDLTQLCFATSSACGPVPSADQFGIRIGDVVDGRARCALDLDRPYPCAALSLRVERKYIDEDGTAGVFINSTCEPATVAAVVITASCLHGKSGSQSDGADGTVHQRDLARWPGIRPQAGLTNDEQKDN